MKKVKYLLFITFLLVGIAAQAINFRENLLFSAKLEAMQVVPATNSTATGVASLMLNPKRDTLSINIGLVGLNATKIAIYQGGEGKNGILLFDLSPFLSGNTLATRIGGAQVKSNLAKILSDGLYLLVSTAANPDGEIRGQIKLEADLHFVTDLSGAQTVPQVSTSAFGLGSFALSGDQSRLDFNIICQEIAVIKTAKLYAGAAGEIGSEVGDLSNFIAGKVISGNFSTNPAFLASLMAGEIYLNITTADNPDGEIRAQLKRQIGLTFDAFATGAQMVPAINTVAKAVCVIRLSPGLDSLVYDIVVSGLTTQIDYSHLHIGFVGEPYDALQVDFSPSITGSRIRGLKKGTAITTSTITKLLTSNLSLVVHTGAYPGGEVRGQIIRFAREGYTVNMTGGQSVPASTSTGFGTGIVSIDRDEKNAHYIWVAGNLSSLPTTAHFHNNSVGQNGAVIYDLAPTMAASANYASGFGYWKSTDADAFTAADALQFSQNKVYLNVHTVDFPDGEIRGQVLRGQIYYPQTTETGDVFVEKGMQIEVSPNPSSSVFLIKMEDVAAEMLDVKLFDLFGKTVFEKNFPRVNSAFSTEIDGTDLAVGIYILTISDGEKLVSQKVVKGL